MAKPERMTSEQFRDRQDGTAKARPNRAAEVVAWCKQLGLPEPLLEHRFHPTRKWRFDVAWPEHKLALEIDGGVFTGGRHTSGAGFKEDCFKFNEAAVLGWRLLRVLPEQVPNGMAMRWVLAILGPPEG